MGLPGSIWARKVCGEYGGPSELEAREDLPADDAAGWQEYRPADELSIDARTLNIDVSTLTVGAGDLIVIRLPRATHPEVFEATAGFLKREFSDNRCVLMHDDASIEAQPPRPGDPA
jgi:hypothetical protein